MQNDYTKSFAQLSELNKSLTEYTLRVNKAIAAGVKPTIKAQADSTISALESAMAHGEKLSQLESPSDVMAEQAALAEDLGKTFQSTAQELVKIQQDTGNELKALLEEGISKFSPEALSSLFKQEKK